MKVKAILTPSSKLTLIKPTDNASFAMEKINELGVLSLPVVDGKRFVGFISKQFLYETFFKEEKTDMNEFLSREVSTFIHTQVDPINSEAYIEQAAKVFFENNVRFIPVINEQNEFLGIVTQKAIFGLLAKVYGIEDPKITIATNDVKGILSKLAEIITKKGGNITNIAMLTTSVKGVDDISIRLVADDVDSIVKKLKKEGFQITDYQK